MCLDMNLEKTKTKKTCILLKIDFHAHVNLSTLISALIIVHMGAMGLDCIGLSSQFAVSKEDLQLPQHFSTDVDQVSE